MNPENRFEQVERYLDGSMSKEELDQFKQDLATDESLQREVEFQQNIEAVLARQPEDDLRENLRKLEEKYDQPPKGGNNNYWIGGLLLVFISALGIWYFSQSSDQPATLAPIEELESGSNRLDSKSNSNLEEKKTEGENKLPETETEEGKKPEETNPPPSQDPEQQTAPKKKKKKRPVYIAADFAANSILESRLSNLRSGEFEITNLKESYLLNSGAIDMALEGSLAPKEALEDLTAQVYIFNNKMADYEAFKPIFSKTLRFEKMEETYQIRFAQSININPGLFYLQVENESGEILYLTKFLVKTE